MNNTLENHQTKKLLVQKEQLTTCAGEHLFNHHNGLLKENNDIFLLSSMLLGLIGLPQTTGAVRRQHRYGQPKYEACATSKNQTQK